MIFVDSDVFIGINNPNDSLHERSVKLLENRVEAFVTSWEVIDEVSTKLSYFFSKEKAINFLESLSSYQIQIEFLDHITSKVAINMFKSQKSKNVSMTDCANMAIARKLKIKTFFSFDEHYTKNGFRLLGNYSTS